PARAARPAADVDRERRHPDGPGRGQGPGPRGAGGRRGTPGIPGLSGRRRPGGRGVRGAPGAGLAYRHGPHRVPRFGCTPARVRGPRNPAQGLGPWRRRMSSSRIAAFYRLPVEERRRKLAEALGLTPAEVSALLPDALPVEVADTMVENAVG